MSKKSLIKTGPAMEIIRKATTQKETPVETTEKKAPNESMGAETGRATATPKRTREKRDRQVLVLLTPSLHEEIKDIALDKHLSVNQVIFTALKDYADKERK